MDDGDDGTDPELDAIANGASPEAVAGGAAAQSGSAFRSGVSQGLDAIGSPITGAIKAISGCDYVGGSSVSTQDRVNDGINAGVALLFAEFPETESELELCENDGCFIAGTPVQLANGKTKQIQKVRVEDRVVTRNSVTGKTEIKRVARLYVHLAHETITVRFADAKSGKVLESLTATPEHPFFVPGLGAVPLGKLGIGTLIVTRAGPLVKIASLVRHEYTKGISVYNFEVPDDHTYFVGKVLGGVWVHNACTPSFNQSGIDTIGQHITGQGFGTDYNTAAINRLQDILDSGGTPAGGDQAFYQHELAENGLMDEGMGYDEAHNAALEMYGQDPYGIYAKEIVEDYGGWFGPGFKGYWGL